MVMTIMIMMIMMTAVITVTMVTCVSQAQEAIADPEAPIAWIYKMLAKRGKTGEKPDGTIPQALVRALDALQKLHQQSLQTVSLCSLL